MVQSGSKPLADVCFTVTFGLWNARKNAHRAGALFWLLGLLKVAEITWVSIPNEQVFHRAVMG